MNEPPFFFASASSPAADPARWAGIGRLRSECLGMVILEIETLDLGGENIFTPREAERAAPMGPRRQKSFTAARVALKRLVRLLGPRGTNSAGSRHRDSRSRRGEALSCGPWIILLGLPQFRFCGRRRRPASGWSRSGGRFRQGASGPAPLSVAARTGPVFGIRIEPGENRRPGLDPQGGGGQGFGPPPNSSFSGSGNHPSRRGRRRSEISGEKIYPARHAEGSGIVMTLVVLDDPGRTPREVSGARKTLKEDPQGAGGSRVICESIGRRVRKTWKSTCDASPSEKRAPQPGFLDPFPLSRSRRSICQPRSLAPRVSVSGTIGVFPAADLDPIAVLPPGLRRSRRGKKEKGHIVHQSPGESRRIKGRHGLADKDLPFPEFRLKQDESLRGQQKAMEAARQRIASGYAQQGGKDLSLDGGLDLMNGLPGAAWKEVETTRKILLRTGDQGFLGQGAHPKIKTRTPPQKPFSSFPAES